MTALHDSGSVLREPQTLLKSDLYHVYSSALFTEVRRWNKLAAYQQTDENMVHAKNGILFSKTTSKIEL